MGFRFRKSIKVGGARINLSKSGIGYSIGTKGFRYTKKAGGGTRTTLSIPGTGISYVSETGKKSAKSKAFPAAKPLPAADIASPVEQPGADYNTNSCSSESKPGTLNVITRHKYCPSCHEEIPSGATKCPHCGTSWTDNDPRLLVEGIIFVAAVLFAIAGVVLGISQWL